MTCINCQQEVSGKFCSNCGQRSTVKRITFREGWNDFWSRVYGFDGMFPRTLRDLTLRPGKVATQYVAGNRVQYYGPVGYFFLMLTLNILAMSMLDIDMAEFSKTVNPIGEVKEGTGQDQFNKGLMGWIQNNQRLLSFLFIPFYVLGAALFFRKSKLNLLEHSVLIFYTQGHYQWLSMIFLLGYKLTGEFVHISIFAGTSALYYGIGCAQLYRQYKFGWAIFRGILVHIFFWFFMFFTTIIITLIVMLLNPEMFEMLRPSNN